MSISPKYGVSVEGSAIANNTLVYRTFQTLLGDALSPTAKQPLEPYQMELRPHLPTSEEAPFVPYFYCGGTHHVLQPSAAPHVDFQEKAADPTLMILASEGTIPPRRCWIKPGPFTL